MPEVSERDGLKVAIRNEAALIQVYGRGSFKMGPALKQFGVSAIVHHRCRRLVIDMAACETMDSTFMGVVAGLAMRLKRENDGRVTIINLAPRTMQLLVTLGLDRVVSAFLTGKGSAEDVWLFEESQALAPVDVSQVERKQNVETMLDAHKDLVAAAPENLARFRDVIEYLNRDADALRNNGA